MPGKVPKTDREFAAWAKRVTAGLDESVCMFGVWDDARAPASVQRYAFALQIGHCLMSNKPLVLAVTEGTVIPPKLAAAATVIVHYRAGDRDSLERATKDAFARLGLIPKH